MTDEPEDIAAAVAAFLAEYDAVRREYEQGYVDADAALSTLAPEIERLREAHEGRA